ncbi:biopolymer transporter ExbD [Burkholderia sp. FERM BP-3421]|uniref:ExbD/TolR family protein n=1 Tax=Burkholderia sp. FERM BP-3421 TaxID=1494466 RepID=UPI0023606306|nr:biopolymer transporter ExbD [Burkholderia sp. FERM BP-3421]WDD92096.1 biopolymer transporter ExbD [Burkholderia sp. FERM BP-3421]
MAFFENSHDDAMSDINMTPLIDVMLVLLIVFMVTLPVVTHSVKLDLPTASSALNDVKPAHVTVSIEASGAVRWDEQVVDPVALQDRIEQAANQQPQPEVQLYADRAARYEAVADLLSAAQRAGLTKIDFVTQPQPK